MAALLAGSGAWASEPAAPPNGADGQAAIVALIDAGPPDGAVLMFQGEDKSVAERFAQTDPYVANGLVSRWYVREWTTVIGDLAANPVRPEAA